MGGVWGGWGEKDALEKDQSQEKEKYKKADSKQSHHDLLKQELVADHLLLLITGAVDHRRIGRKPSYHS